MKIKLFACLVLFGLIAGCGSSEPTSITDGVPQSEIDKYNAMMKAEAALMAEGGEEDDI